MTALAPASGNRPLHTISFEGTAAWRGTPVRTQIRILTARSVRDLVLDRRLLAMSMVEPLLMLVAFGQVFSALARAPGFPPGVRYIDFLMPALLLTTALHSGVQAGMGIADDTRSGMLDRLRSLPIRPGSVLLARSIAGLARAVLRLAVLLAFASVLFGYRPFTHPAGLLAAVALSLTIGWSLGWVFTALACWIERTEPLYAAAGLLMFPLTFASNAFVPIGQLPPWLRWTAGLNPVTHGINATRDLCLSGAVGTGALTAALTSLAIAAVTAPVAARGLNRPH